MTMTRRPISGRLAGLERLDEGQRLPDSRQVVARILDVGVGAHAHAEEDRVRLRGDRLEGRTAVDAPAELELDAEPLERVRLVGERVAHLAVGRDREADEPADLVALVVDRDRVAAGGELACAGEAGGADADHGDLRPFGRAGTRTGSSRASAQSVA